MEPLFVYVTCRDRNEAIHIGKAAVRDRLAACANVIGGMESIYWWQGNLEVSQETVLILKSRRDLLATLTENIKSEHSYEVPCIVALPIEDGNRDYLDWLLAETRS